MGSSSMMCSCRTTTATRTAIANAGANGEGVPAATFQPVASPEALRADADAIGATIATWLDEEWVPLPEHQQLARVVADVWVRLRSAPPPDADDVATVLLGLAGELMSGGSAFDFGPTFTSAFEVANKAVELGMVRDGMETCGCGGEQVEVVVGGGGGSGSGGGGGGGIA
jgi:hypothetical protein